MNLTRKLIPLFLWAVVLVALLIVMRQRLAKSPGPVAPVVTLDPTGAEMVEVPWRHLPDVPDFKLTNQAGEAFDSKSLNGKVYAVYFFFSTCPSICRDLNRQIERLNGQLKSYDITFLGVSVDPDVDQPEVLARYAQDFGATVPRWQMLTGPFHRVRELGEYGLRMTVAKEVHTDNIVLVDRWGRYRDRFRWDDPVETKRFVETARELIDETVVPLDERIITRNAMAAVHPADWTITPWIREFELTDQDGGHFFSRDMTGEVWVGSFFFSRCPTICVEQNRYLSGLISRTSDSPFPVVSISTDSGFDTPEVLRAYASGLGADTRRWRFLTGDPKLVRRTAAEYFSAPAGEDHHSTMLFVVDRWHRVRGKFDWQKPEDEAAMLELIRQLKAEPAPGHSPASGESP